MPSPKNLFGLQKKNFKTYKAYNEQKCYKFTKGWIKGYILDFNTAKYWMPSIPCNCTLNAKNSMLHNIEEL